MAEGGLDVFALRDAECIRTGVVLRQIPMSNAIGLPVSLRRGLVCFLSEGSGIGPRTRIACRNFLTSVK